jgi:hypothetical protein
MSAKSKHSERRKKEPQKQQQANLGQKEAKQQQRSKSELSHMGKTSRSDKMIG